MTSAGFNPVTFHNMFKSRGFTKPNKFLARIPMPQGLQGATTYNEKVREVQFWCESSNLPGVMLGAYDVNRYSYGPRERRPVTSVFQDTAFTFFADAGGDVGNTNQNPTIGTYYDFFTNWSRLISNFDRSKGISAPNTTLAKGRGGWERMPYELGYKIDYISNIEIYVFDDQGKPSHFVTLRDAFPLMVNDTRLNWGDNSGVMRISVIMTYTDWFISETMDIDDNPEQGPANPSGLVVSAPLPAIPAERIPLPVARPIPRNALRTRA